jgi:long-chain acyl-CoA synthetase
LPNTPHYFIAFFGILKAGGTVVNYSPLDAAAVLEHKIADSETDILFTLDMKALFPQMHHALGATRLRGLIIGLYGDFAAHPDVIAAAQRAAGDVVDVPWGDEIRRFSDLLDGDATVTRHPFGDPAETIAVLQYTGGTTGLPKGAILTHANLTAATSQILETTQTDPPVLRPGGERMLAVLPPFHVYALVVNMLMGLKLGAELVLHARFDLQAVLSDLSAKRVTVFCGVPTMYVGLLQADLSAFDLSSLRLCNSGGAPLPLEIQERFQSVSGASLNEGAVRRTGGDCGAGPQCDEGVLEESEGDAGDALGRGFFAHRRCRVYGRGRVCLYRGPHEGHAVVRWVQCVSAGDRGGDLPAPGRGGSGGGGGAG